MQLRYIQTQLVVLKAHSEERAQWNTERTALEQLHRQLETELDDIARELSNMSESHHASKSSQA